MMRRYSAITNMMAIKIAENAFGHGARRYVNHEMHYVIAVVNYKIRNNKSP